MSLITVQDERQKRVCMDASQLQFRSHYQSEQLEQSLTSLLSFKHVSTYHHSNRVAAIALEWATFMKSRHLWANVDVSVLVSSARLHDIGKIGVLDQILSKSGPLTNEERLQMNLHAEIGYEMTREMPHAPELSLAVRHHHERWDGGGYPLGLKGEEIPFFARVIALVDAFDAMTSDRSYQKARAPLEALKEIQLNAGRQFCPELTAAFVQFLHARNT